MALAAWMSGPRSSSACKGMKDMGWLLETDVAIARAIPLVLGVVWFEAEGCDAGFIPSHNN